MPFFPTPVRSIIPRASWRLAKRCCASGSSSSSEETASDYIALAARYQLSQRKVKETLHLLHEQGMRLYGEGDHIPKSDKEIILLDLDIDYGNAASYTQEGDISQQIDDADDDSNKPDSNCNWNNDALEAKLEKLCRSQPTERLFDALRKVGFRIGGDRGHHVYARSGKKHVLRQTRWDPSVDFPKLWTFVKENKWEGMYCQTCQVWFEQACLDEAVATGSVKYALTESYRLRCIGACDSAKRWAERQK